MHTGWVDHVNSAGERVRYLLPPLLPMAVGADLVEVAVPTPVVQAVVLGSGLTESAEDDYAAVARARRATTVVVRDARFAKQVVDAYGGMCAMCGLDAGLIEGAHIYPAAAPGSPDKAWNALALCPTHHSIFDRHLVGVRPTDRTIVYSPTLAAQVSGNVATAALVDSTFPSLALPQYASMHPKHEMFTKRYEHFARQYDWLVA
jgi:HNH endonuclease